MNRRLPHFDPSHPSYYEPRISKERAIPFRYIFAILALCIVLGSVMYAVTFPNPFATTQEETP